MFQNVGDATRNARHAIFVRAKPSAGIAGKFVHNDRKRHSCVSDEEMGEVLGFLTELNFLCGDRSHQLYSF